MVSANVARRAVVALVVAVVLLVGAGASAEAPEYRLLRYLVRASDELRVPEDFSLAVKPERIVTRSGKSDIWTYSLDGRTFRVDVARLAVESASDKVLRFLAYHEVCHMKHDRDVILMQAVQSPAQVAASEARADSCALDYMPPGWTLGPGERRAYLRQ